MPMPYLGPITQSMFEPDNPPAIIREWAAKLSAPDNYVFFWAAAMRGTCWSDLQTALGEDDTGPNPVEATSPLAVERLLAPLAQEGRIRIMQALFRGPMTPSELTARTGFQGGGLYHHLKELKYAAYVSDSNGRYALTSLGRQLLVTVTLIAKDAVVDRGEEGLVVGGVWDNATLEAEAGGRIMEHKFQPVLAYTVAPVNSESPLAQTLHIEITELTGTSATVAPGDRFTIRGRYTQKGDRVAWLRLSAIGTSSGEQARIASGSGTFVGTAEIAEVVPGRENALDLLMADAAGADLGGRLRILLTPRAS